MPKTWKQRINVNIESLSLSISFFPILFPPEVFVSFFNLKDDDITGFFTVSHIKKAKTSGDEINFF